MIDYINQNKIWIFCEAKVAWKAETRMKRFKSEEIVERYISLLGREILQL